MKRTAQVGALAEQHVMQYVVRAGCNVALPVADIDGVDLYVCGPNPPQTAALQVKGHSDGGFRVFLKHAQPWLHIAYVLFSEPGQFTDPELYLMTGVQAWELPGRHQLRGPRRASDHDRINGPSYRWDSLRTGLAREVYDDIQQYRISSPDHFVTTLFPARSGARRPVIPTR